MCLRKVVNLVANQAAWQSIRRPCLAASPHVGSPHFLDANQASIRLDAARPTDENRKDANRQDVPLLRPAANRHWDEKPPMAAG